MNTSVQLISIPGLVWSFVPVLVVLIILSRWTRIAKNASYGVLRMLVQLLLIGYVLTYIFNAENPLIVVAVLIVMIVAASWIAIRPLEQKQPKLYRNALLSIVTGGGLIFILVTQIVVNVDPWFSPRYVVPLAGMIFASSMNSVSLAAERLEAELCTKDFLSARGIALRASLIPVINSLFAVGLVSLPGMMTGQILSGVSPVIASKYQIVVMCMIFSASGLSSAVYLALVHPAVKEPQAANSELKP